jgi:hypothetical protein
LIFSAVGTYTDPKHIIAYADGQVRRRFNVCFTARITGGRLEIPTRSPSSGSCRRKRSSVLFQVTHQLRADAFSGGKIEECGGVVGS